MKIGAFFVLLCLVTGHAFAPPPDLNVVHQMVYSAIECSCPKLLDDIDTVYKWVDFYIREHEPLIQNLLNGEVNLFIGCDPNDNFKWSYMDIRAPEAGESGGRVVVREDCVHLASSQGAQAGCNDTEGATGYAVPDSYWHEQFDSYSP